MRIMIVDPGHDFSTLAIAESYTRAFERLGYEIVEYDTLRALRIVGSGLKAHKFPTNLHQTSEMACAPILSQVIIDSIDVVLVIHGIYMNPAIVMAIRKTGCKVGLILTDDPMQVSLSKRYSQYYDFVFTNDKNTVNQHKNCYYLPVAVDETIFVPGDDLFRMYDLLVAWSFYKERFDFLADERIKKILLKNKTAMLGARSRDTGDPDLDKLFIRKKVSYEELAIHLASSFVCIDFPRNEFVVYGGEGNKEAIKATCVSPRILECIATKTICITTDVRESLYEIVPQDLLTVASKEEDFETISDKFLNDSKERQRITNILYYEVLPKNTYFERAKTIEKIMGLAVGINKKSIGTINQQIMNKWDSKWKENYNHCVKSKHYIPERSVSFYKDRFVEQYKDALSEMCNIVSNGPSLEETASSERFFADNFVTFYLNEAVKIVQSFHKEKFAVVIHPDDDVYERCYADFGCCSKITLLTSTLACHKVADRWIAKDGKVVFFNSSGEEGVKKKVIERVNYPVFSSGLSVAYSAITAAIYMGFKKINLFGLDFSYVNNRKYAYKHCSFTDLNRSELLVVQDNKGSPVLTDHTLLRSRNSVLGLIKSNPDIEFKVFGRGILYNNEVSNLRFST